MTDLLMLDTVDVNQLSGLRFDAAAGYVGGSWPDWSSECAAYPDLAKQGRILSIAVNSGEEAECIDCEAGDASPGEVPGWIDRQLGRGVWRPCVYANLDTWANQGLRNLTNHYGSGIRRWVAEWDYNPSPHVLGGYDAQQWSDRYAARNIDGSFTLDSFFAPAPQPQHQNQPHYEWFASGPVKTFNWGTVDERQTVQSYDALRKIAKRNAGQEQQIHRLMAICAGLANRVAHAAFADPLPNGKPQWGLHHRGWRRLQLSLRGHGRQVVP